jgi:hypothetical protein
VVYNLCVPVEILSNGKLQARLGPEWGQAKTDMGTFTWLGDGVGMLQLNVNIANCAPEFFDFREVGEITFQHARRVSEGEGLFGQAVFESEECQIRRL